LSGGEKSISSLALQYSLAVVSKSPFLILDESDSFLDTKNTDRLYELIERSYKSTNLIRLDKNMQIILISHKKSVYESSESLVGITRPNKAFSQAFSLFLGNNN